MRRLAAPISACLALSATPLPATALPGGPFPMHRGSHSHGGFRPPAARKPAASSAIRVTAASSLRRLLATSPGSSIAANSTATGSTIIHW